MRVTVTYALVPAKDGHYGITHHVEGTSSGKSKTGALQSLLLSRPVLTKFRLSFTNGDHHIDRMGVEVWPGNWRVTFDDKNDDDPYLYEFDWASIGRTQY